jgi:hypothetical protein
MTGKVCRADSRRRLRDVARALDPSNETLGDRGVIDVEVQPAPPPKP